MATVQATELMTNQAVQCDLFDRNALPTVAFNQMVFGFATAYASSLGLFDYIQERGNIRLSIDSAKLDLDCGVLYRILKILANNGVLVESKSGEFVPGSNFVAITATSGFFEWLALGYGGVLVDISNVRCPDKNLTDCPGRDGGVIATASAKMARHFVEATYRQEMSQVQFASVVDLGCGEASRLISFAIKNSGIIAVGVEIDANAVAIARHKIQELGLASRVSILQQDVASLKPVMLSQLSSPLVMMNFMGHDLWPKENALKIFSALRRILPEDCTFFLADSVRSQTDVHPGMLTAGFELVHAMIGKYIPSTDEWLQLFTDTGWIINKTVVLAVPDSVLFILTSR